MHVMPVPEAKPGSWEHIVHQLGGDRIVFLRPMKELLDDREFLHRAIGVIYFPETERSGNYVPSIMTSRYDAFVHIDETHALYPIHLIPDGQQVPETFPFGF